MVSQSEQMGQLTGNKIYKIWDLSIRGGADPYYAVGTIFA